MIEKNVEESNLSEKSVEATPTKHPAMAFAWGTLSGGQVTPTILLITLCTIAFVVCILLTVAPLSRIPDAVIHLQTPIGSQLVQVGTWLPGDLGFNANHLASTGDTGYVEFLMLIAIAFAIYGLCALFISRQPEESNNRPTLRLIWLGTLLAGLIYVFTPAMLSHDILVYASYSRLMAIYHANPYLVPLSTYPQDPFTSLNYWSSAIAAYGPLWLAICAFWGLFLGPQPLGYILAFRLFALAAHLFNIWLVTTILRTSGQSSRTVTLGTLLNAWNPLVLLESSLGGHNDVFMVTFILLGVLFSVRANRRGQLTHLRGYLPAIVAFTLAALIKFTMLPLIVLFIILLACKALRPAASAVLPTKEEVLHRWQRAFLTVLSASIISALVALALYGPFWIGHNLHDIKNSFVSPPSALYAENSILRAILAWQHDHPLSPHTLGYNLINIFSMHKTWDYISIATLAGVILPGVVWLWYSPTIRTFVLATLATLGALLIVTPWFYSWYVTWLIGLIAVSLPIAHKRLGRALLAFTLTFSASAFLTYLFKDGYPPFGIWTGLVCLTTIAPPLLAFVMALVAWRPVPKAVNEPVDDAQQEKLSTRLS